MTAAKLGRDEFIELYRTIGPSQIAKRYLLDLTGVKQRRQRIERKLGIEILPPDVGRSRGRGSQRTPVPSASHRIELDVQTGCVVVASDMHLWPGEVSLMFRALVQFVKELKPRAIILNGDVMDLPRASRHAAIGWEKRPEIHEEIEWAQEKLHELELAAPRGCELIWDLGNHDARFESRIANLAPEYAKVHGVHLRDHFSLWRPAWSTYINASSDPVLVKHRFRGGIHAVHNNLLWTGGHVVTGHLHSAQVRALTYYNDRSIWGMDTGCVAEPTARTFVDYTEDSPKNWRSGFGVLTFHEGRLLPPELVLKHDSERVVWRGELIEP
jgi:Calcineurin-like phosphoesterase